MNSLFTQEPTIILGTSGRWLFQRALKLTIPEVRTHHHILGISGSGKSRYIAGLYIALLKANLSCTLVDPHGDLSYLVLAHLVADGFFRIPGASKKLIYLDLPAADKAERYMPFNVLSQSARPHTVASNITEAFHRAWPSLAGGSAPMFDTLVQNGVKVLLSNNLPLTALYRFLTDKGYRDTLLEKETDLDVTSVFHDWYDRLAPKDQLDQSGSTIRRVNLLTFDPVLKYSLGQVENILNFREIMDANQSLIINLAIHNAEGRRLMGCLLTVSAEQGALSRAELPPEERTGSHHLVIDEFSEFTAQSEESLARILSLTRKYGLFIIMAHQTWSQASSRLQGALQNVGVETIFRLGRADAEASAKILGHVDPMEIKHEVADEHAIDRTHPVFFSLPEQWEQTVQEIQELRPRQAFIKYHPHPKGLFKSIRRQPSHKVAKVKTVPMPNPKVNRDELARVEAYYLATCFRPKEEIEKELARYRQPAVVEPVIRKRTPVKV